MLYEYGPAFFAQFKEGLPDPEGVEMIPVTKLRHVPLRAMDRNQSKISGNIDAISDMLAQAGVGDPADPGRFAPDDLTDISEFVQLVHGDLGTMDKVISAMERWAIELSPRDRLQFITFVLGLFHLKMAAADAIWRILVTPIAARADQTSFFSLVGKLRPRETARLSKTPKFRQQHQLIRDVSVLLILNAWDTEVRKRKKLSLEEWAKSSPSLSLQEIDEIAQTLVKGYVEGEGINMFELRSKPLESRDQQRENTIRVANYLLLYEELAYAMNAGDIGRVETLFQPWIQLFRATGKHKYGKRVLLFVHQLYFVFPEGLRYVNSDSGEGILTRSQQASDPLQYTCESHRKAAPQSCIYHRPM